MQDTFEDAFLFSQVFSLSDLNKASCLIFCRTSVALYRIRGTLSIVLYFSLLNNETLDLRYELTVCHKSTLIAVNFSENAFQSSGIV